MTVYVDPSIHPFGRMVMCHMWADTVEELVDMARRIGVDPKWIQGHPTLSFGKHRYASWVHFDISKGRRAKAVAFGAVEVDRYEAVAHVARLDVASDDEYRQERGARRLSLVSLCREKARRAE